MTTIQPQKDRVLLKRSEHKEEMRNGIVLPDIAKEKPLEATVVAVGPGAYQRGVFIVPSVKPGDRVIIGKYSGAELIIDQEEYLVVRDDEILATIEESLIEQGTLFDLNSAGHLTRPAIIL